MAKLYIDTTDGLVIFLLDSDNSLLDCYEYGEKRNADRIHFEIYNILQKNNLFFDQLEVLFQASGPGSYTGIRLADGIGQVLEWSGIKRYSFNHFDVMKILGIGKGQFIAPAFKGEYFLYRWNDSINSSSLILKESMPPGTYFSNYQFLEEEIRSLGISLQKTQDLIKQECKRFFDIVEKDKLKFDPYYYRPLDSEFKVGKIK